VGLNVSKSATLLLILAFLTAPCIMANSALSSADVAGSWVSKAPMQVARGSLGVAVVNGKIYAIGGFVENGVVTGVNEEYDPGLDAWVLKASMPTPRAHFATAVFQNKIYCIGGTENGGINEVYDPETDTWENRTCMPTPRSYITANIVNGKIYIISGFVPNASVTGGLSRVALNEVYDPETDSWTTKASMSNAAKGYVSAVVDDKIYIIDSNLNQIYDAKTDTWSLGVPPPSEVGHGAAGATTGVNALKRIYVLTEMLYGESRFNQVYDPEHDRWSYGAAVPTSRLDFNVAVVNDRLYAIGGFSIKAVSIDEYIRTGEQYKQTWYATNEQYTPFGYGTPDPSYDGTAPEVTVASPENRTYHAADVALNFTVNEPASLRYTLDGENAVEISGNTTLTGLAYGTHNITVYAVDAAGNTGASETITFTVAEEPEPFPTALVATASGAVVAVIGIGLLAYFRKRHH
jgi:N-acetylneuraminic acid mutarotase